MLLLPSEEIVIAGAARTPIGGFDGILKAYPAPRLGAAAIVAALERAGMPTSAVDEVILGQVVTAGCGQAPAKQASVAAGIPHHVPATQLNSVCASGLTSVWYGMQSILTRTAGVVVAGGMESRSNAPYLLGPRTRSGTRLAGSLLGEDYHLTAPLDPEGAEDYRALFEQVNDARLIEANIHDGLGCPFAPDTSMLDYAVRFADEQGFTPEAVDRAARESYRKAQAAWDEGRFDAEVVAVGDARRDELTPRSRWEALCGRSASPCTAYNTPPLADGGAAVVLMSGARERALGISPGFRILGMSRVDCRPEAFVTAPVLAVRELEETLVSSGGPADFPLMEANESFGLQILLFERTWPGRVINPKGGAVALKHPLGAGGVRLLTTLLYTLAEGDHPRGIAVICFGGGGAVAIAVEREA